MSGTLDSWIGTSGSWSNAAKWQNGLPTAQALASFGGSAAETITFATTAAIDGLAGGDTAATLDMTSGVLSIATGGSWSGQLLQAGGTLAFSAGTLTVTGAYNQHSAATADITGGATLLLTGGGALSGHTAGAGLLALAGGEFTVGSAAAFGAGTVEIADNGGTVTLGTNETVAGSFTLNGGGLALAGHTLTLKGASYLSGGSSVSGPGEMAIDAPSTIGYLTVTAGATLHVAGTALESGNLQLGTGTTDSATLGIGGAGTFELAADAGITASGTARIVSAGVLEKSGGAGNSFIAADLTSTGKIVVNQGTIGLQGAADTISGAVSGAGVLNIDGGTLDLETAAITVGGFGVYGNATTVNLSASPVYAGNFVLDGTTLAMASGTTLTLTGGDYLRGLIEGAGGVAVSGPADLAYLTLSGGIVLTDKGLMTEDAPLTIGAGTADHATLAITAAATFDLLYSNAYIYANGTAAIHNAGLFEITGASDTSVVFADMTSTGTLLAATGNTLALEGASNALNGALLGAGEIDLRGGGTFSIASGTTLGVGTLGILDGGTLVKMAGNRTYAGTLLLETGTLEYAASGSLTLTGDVDLAGTLLGKVVATSSGDALTGGMVLSGHAKLVDAGSATQNGNVTLGTGSADVTTLRINAGASYDLGSDGTIFANGTATLSNAGLFEKTAIVGSSYVLANVVSTGTILDTLGTLALAGAANTLGGKLLGAGEIDLRGGGQFTLTAGIVLGVATLGVYDPGTTVTLDASKTYSGVFSLGSGATLDLAGVTLTLHKASLDGTVVGGTVLVTNSAETGGLVLTGGATLDDASLAVLDNANVTLGTSSADAATLLIGAGHLYEIRTDNTIFANGAATIDNAGKFAKIGFTGTSTVFTDMDSTGTLAVNEGTLVLDGASNTFDGQLIGAGELDLRDGGTSTFAAGIAISVATLGVYDSGTDVSLAGNVLYKGAFTLGTSTGLALNGHSFTVDGTGLLQGGISGAGKLVVAGSADAQYLLVTGGATLAVAGILTQDYFITLGSSTTDTSTITVAVGGTYDLISDNAIFASGTATISNAGTFEKTETNGTSVVQAAVVNTGLISVGIGTIDFQGALTNDGTVAVTAASVVVAGALGEDAGQHGAFDIGANGLVAVLGSVDAAQSFAFAGGGGTLRLSDPTDFAGSISGFASGDTIDLAGILANGLTYSGGVLTVTETTNGSLDATYTLNAPGIADPGALMLVYDNNGGTAIVLNHAGPQFTNPSGTIYVDTWTADASGTWSDGANWYQVVPAPPPIYSETLHVQPDAGNDANFFPSGNVTAPFIVSYNEADAVNQLNGDSYATLDMSGGTLTVNAGGGWAGGFTITGGTLDAVTGWTASGPTSLGTAATDEVDSGTFAIGSGTLAGTVDGQGEFYLIGGDNFTIEHGFTITSGVFDLGVNPDGFGSNTTLETNLGYGGFFVLTDYSGNSANLYLNGHTLTLSGGGSLNGYVSGGGALVLSGSLEVGGLTVNNSALLKVSGTVGQDGLLTIGNGASPDATTVTISKTGVWDFINNSSINGYGASTIDNLGLIEKTGGTGGSNIGGSVFIDTGKITVAVGALDIGAGNNTIEGAIGGAGELYFDGGPNFLIGAGAAITTAIWDLGVNGDGFGSNTTLDISLGYAGRFILTDYSGNSANLFLNGETLTLKGTATLNGYISGNGAVDVTRLADVSGQTINNSATVNVTGKMTQDGNVVIGNGTGTDTTTIAVLAGGTYDFLNDNGISLYGSSVFSNTGLLEKTGGIGVSGLFGGTFTNTGTLLVATGQFDLGGNSNIGGVVTGAGSLGLYVGSSTLDAGATISTSNLALLLNGDGFGASLTLDENFTYGGSFESYDYSGNATFLNLNGFNATFTGSSFWNGQLNGAGTLAVAGHATFAGQGVSDALVKVTQTAYSTGNLSLANGAALTIAAAGVFDMLDDGNAETGGSVTSAGLIEKTAGAGISYIQGNLTSTGTITAATGTIYFQNAPASTIGGTVSGGGTVNFFGGGSYTIKAGTVLSVATLGLSGTITLGGNFAYHNSFDFAAGTLGLSGHNLTLSGPTTLDGTIAGGGTLTVGQGVTAMSTGLTLAGAGVVNDAGTLIEVGAIVFGTTATDAPTLEIAATGVLNLNGDGYSTYAGAPVLMNAGLIEKTGVTGTSVLDASLSSTGTILVNQGTLVIVTPAGGGSLGGTVAGAGSLTLQGGSTTLATGLSLTIAAFTLTSSATNVLNLNLSYAGDYTLNSGTESLNGDTLTLAGVADLANGTIAGPGLLRTSGTALLGYLTEDGGSSLNNAGALAQVGNLTLGDASGGGTALNAAGKVWNFIADGSVYSGGGAEGTFTNRGLLEKTAGTGVSDISANFVSVAGATLDIATGSITIGTGTAVFAGTVEGAGSLLVNAFATISSLSVVGGSPDFAGGASVSGTIVETGATLFTAGTLSGAGTIDLASHSVAQVGGTVTSGITVAFMDATDTLGLVNPAGFAGKIAGFVAGDTLDLLNTPAASVTGVTYAASTLTIDVAGGTSFALRLPGSFTSGSFHVAADGHNGAAITV